MTIIAPPPASASEPLMHAVQLAARAHADALHESSLPVWTVYENPADFPGQFVARMHLVRAGLHHPTITAIAGDTLDAVRRCLPDGLIKFGRSPQDEPQIVECWL